MRRDGVGDIEPPRPEPVFGAGLKTAEPEEFIAERRVLFGGEGAAVVLFSDVIGAHFLKEGMEAKQAVFEDVVRQDFELFANLPEFFGGDFVFFPARAAHPLRERKPEEAPHQFIGNDERCAGNDEPDDETNVNKTGQFFCFGF